MVPDDLSSEDGDEDSIVVIDEDYGERDDVFEDDVEEPEVAQVSSEDLETIFGADGDSLLDEVDDECNENAEGDEGLEWHYEYGPAYPASADRSPPRHATCGYATRDSDEEYDYEKVAFEEVDSIPLSYRFHFL